MNKKRADTKVLVPLDSGFSIREVREFKTDSKTDVRTQIGSTIAIYQGKKMVKDGFKNTEKAKEYFDGDLNKRNGNITSSK